MTPHFISRNNGVQEFFCILSAFSKKPLGTLDEIFFVCFSKHVQNPPRTHLVITKFSGQNVVDGFFTNLRNLVSQLPKRYSPILEENALNLRRTPMASCSFARFRRLGVLRRTPFTICGRFGR